MFGKGSVDIRTNKGLRGALRQLAIKCYLLYHKRFYWFSRIKTQIFCFKETCNKKVYVFVLRIVLNVI